MKRLRDLFIVRIIWPYSTVGKSPITSLTTWKGIECCWRYQRSTAFSRASTRSTDRAVGPENASATNPAI
jgi:hypothetical protein